MTRPNRRQALDPVPGEPDWLAAFRAYARVHGIAAAGAKIGRARPTASLILSGQYPAGTDKAEALVRAHLMGQVRCPAFGDDIPLAECREWASRPFSAASARSAAMYRACRACPHRPQTEEAPSEQA